MNNTHIALKAVIAHEIALRDLRAGDFFSFSIAGISQNLIDAEENLYRVNGIDSQGTLLCTRMYADGLPAPTKVEFKQGVADDSALTFFLRMIITEGR
jgi:hypothetical protein